MVLSRLNKNSAFHKGRRLSGTLSSSSSSSLLSSLYHHFEAVGSTKTSTVWIEDEAFALYFRPDRVAFGSSSVSAPPVHDARGLVRGQIGAVGFDWFLGWCNNPLRRLENSLVFVPIDCQLIINITLSHHAQTKLDDCGVFVTNFDFRIVF